MATYLVWSLLGVADLNWLNSVDNPSVSLIHVLYSFFLIMAVILLVNMMIALLSNTYQQVQVLNGLSLPSLMYVNSVHNPELRKYEKFSTLNSEELSWRKKLNTFFAKFIRFYDHL